MAPLKLRFSRRAEQQLGNILDFIAMENPEAADKIATHVESLLEKVQFFPELGPQIFPNLPHREIVAYPCRILYCRRGETLWVAAVLRVEQLVRLRLLD